MVLFSAIALDWAQRVVLVALFSTAFILGAWAYVMDNNGRTGQLEAWSHRNERTRR